MPAQIVLIGQLKTFFGDRKEITIESGRSVRETLVSLDVKPDLVAGVVVNGDLRSKDYLVQENDRIELFAVMAGG